MLLWRQDPKDKRGKWSDVFKSLALILILYMGFRWILFEPYVIPSGSMKQTLLIQDYVIVKKWAFGIRIPFTSDWLVGPSVPERGDIVVFHSKGESGHILVKRVIGLPGDQIMIDEKGFIQINDSPFAYQPIEENNPEYDVYLEDNGEKSYRIQLEKDFTQTTYDLTVPDGHLFMMGDNRNYSSDSRFWGPLPLEKIMGKLTMIWMSCEESDTYSSFLCAPKDFRKDRFFKKVDSGD